MRTDFKFDIVNIASKITRVNDMALSNCAHRELNFTIQALLEKNKPPLLAYLHLPLLSIHVPFFIIVKDLTHYSIMIGMRFYSCPNS